MNYKLHKAKNHCLIRVNKTGSNKVVLSIFFNVVNNIIAYNDAGQYR